MQVGVLVLKDLEQPVLQLDIRIAAQLAEHGCALDRLVRKRIELAKQSGAADFRHECSPQSPSFNRALRPPPQPSRFAGEEVFCPPPQAGEGQGGGAWLRRVNSTQRPES